MTENELLTELIKLNYIEPVDLDNEVTHAMLAQALGISERQATVILQAEVKAGRLTVREARAQSGFKVKAYKRVE